MEQSALFQALARGEAELPTALKIIRQTRQQAEQVRHLLRELSDTSEGVALAKRFKRVKRKLDAGELPAGLDPETAYDRFAELSLAVHELDMRLLPRTATCSRRHGTMPAALRACADVGLGV